MKTRYASQMCVNSRILTKFIEATRAIKRPRRYPVRGEKDIVTISNMENNKVEYHSCQYTEDYRLTLKLIVEPIKREENEN